MTTYCDVLLPVLKRGRRVVFLRSVILALFPYHLNTLEAKDTWRTCASKKEEKYDDDILRCFASSLEKGPLQWSPGGKEVKAVIA